MNEENITNNESELLETQVSENSVNGQENGGGETVEKERLKLIPLKIISALIHAVALIFLLVLLISVLKEYPENGLGLAIYLVISIAYFAISFGASLLSSLIGLIISLTKRKTYQAKSCVIYFSVLSAVSLGSYLLNLLLTIILINV